MLGSSTKELEFKKEAREFLAHLLSHLFENSPLKYAIICSAVCWYPLYLGNMTKRNYYQNHVGIILQTLVYIGRFSGKSAEVVKEEYVKFFDIVDQNLQSFSFNPSQDRVDTLFLTGMESSKLCTNIWDFLKMFLILYHGQSAIERGFNINK